MSPVYLAFGREAVHRRGGRSKPASRERFGFEPREIAVMAASHAGEPFHVASRRARSCDKIGMDASALQCGVHLAVRRDGGGGAAPRGRGADARFTTTAPESTPASWRSARSIGADPATYLSADNPAQRRILEFCARLSDDDAATWPIGIDGCGIPVYATSLRKAALSFARLRRSRGVDDARRRGATCRARCDDGASAVRRRHRAVRYRADASPATGTSSRRPAPRACTASRRSRQEFGYVSKVLDGSVASARPFDRSPLCAGWACSTSSKPPHSLDLRAPTVYNRAGHAVGEIRVLRGRRRKSE